MTRWLNRPLLIGPIRRVGDTGEISEFDGAGSRSAGSAGAGRFADPNELYLEDQYRTAGDLRRCPSPAVAQPRGHRELALAAYLHAFNALVPAFDDLARPEDEFEWLYAAAGAVEDAAIGKGADVVNNNRLAGEGFRTVPHLEVFGLKITSLADDGL